MRAKYCRRLVSPFIAAVIGGISSAALAQSDTTSSSKSSDNLAECVVVDPTSTPLNIRAEPQGQIISTISNGQLVRVLREKSDTRSKRWAYVADANSRPLGWVFREHLACR
ncbi:SH3 domain-containing protein [Bradyrhizobium mercantei]|uniref:SH3 domain-containing protein n=1 Tax=Bradyrhizobium mercantei TaxID=1904807 RepID=UPI000977FDFD